MYAVDNGDIIWEVKITLNQAPFNKERNMNRGKWYFVYRCIDEMENGTFRDGEDKEVPLYSTTENEAVAEAKAEWIDVQAQCAMHSLVFTISPRPRVIYMIPLGEEGHHNDEMQ